MYQPNSDIADMMKRTSLASPCSARWDEMTGDEKARHCSQCKLDVLNAESMTDEEVTQAIMSLVAGKRVCMRIFRRADGTILTKDCPIGARKIKERLRTAAGWLAGGLSILLASAAAAQSKGGDCDPKKKEKPLWHSQVTADAPAAANGKPPAGEDVSGAKPRLNIPVPGQIAPPQYSDEEVAKGEQAVKDDEAKYGRQSQRRADSLQRVGMMYYWQHKYTQSKAAYSEALAIYEKLAKPSLMRSCLTQLASICDAQKDTAGSADYRRRHKKLVEAEDK